MWGAKSNVVAEATNTLVVVEIDEVPSLLSVDPLETLMDSDQWAGQV